MSRTVKTLLAVAVVAAVVAFGIRALGGEESPAPAVDGSEQSGSGSGVPPVPQDAPAEGLYVRSEVTADGEVAVQTWLRTPTPVTELLLTTTDPDLAPGSVESLGLVVHALDGTILARRDSVGTNPQRIRLRAPATELFFRYTIDGGLDDASQSVEGRALVRVVGMDVDYEGADSPTSSVRRLVTSPGTVLNVACLRPNEDFDASPRPCGGATDDGDWLVDLTGKDRQDRLLAQVEQ